MVLWREPSTNRITLTVTSIATERAMQEAIADGLRLEASEAPARDLARRATRGCGPSSARRKARAATTRPPSIRNRGVIHVLMPHQRKTLMTTSTRRVVLTLLCSAMSASLLGAQGRPHYRAYQMGDDVLTISRQLGVPSPAGTLMPPALGAVEELRWRPQYVRRGVAPSSDPVARLVFSFFENQLFRIVIDYASARTEGMTEADVVAAVSKVYGAPARRTHPPSPVGLRPQRPADSVVAQWTDGGHQVALLAAQDQIAFRLIVSSAPLEAFARAAGAHEAPADLDDRGSVDAARPNEDIESTAHEKTRRANIASFIP